jgi:hypothetical protein
VTCQPVERRLRRHALHDERSDLVCVPLVRISNLADAALELNATALLDHVRRLVGHGVQIGALTQHDVITRCVGACAHLAGACRRARAYVGLDPRDVVPPECALDLIGVLQL